MGEKLGGLPDDFFDQVLNGSDTTPKRPSTARRRSNDARDNVVRGRIAGSEQPPVQPQPPRRSAKRPPRTGDSPSVDYQQVIDDLFGGRASTSEQSRSRRSPREPRRIAPPAAEESRRRNGRGTVARRQPAPVAKSSRRKRPVARQPKQSVLHASFEALPPLLSRMSMPSKKKLGAFAAAGLVVVGGVTNSEQFEKLPFLRPDPTPVKTIGQLAVATVDADVGMLTKWQLEKGKPMKTDVGTFGDHDIRIKAVASDVDAGDAVSDTNTGYEVDLSKVKLDFAPVSRKTNPEIPEVIRDYPTPPPGQPNANEFKRLYEKNLGFVNRLPDAALIDEITGKTERTIDGTKVGRAAVIGWVEEALRERHHLGDETTITFVNPDKFAAEAQGNQYLARYVEIAKADGKDYSQAQQEVDIYRADKLNAAEGARKLPISTSPDVSDVKVKILGD